MAMGLTSTLDQPQDSEVENREGAQIKAAEELEQEMGNDKEDTRVSALTELQLQAQAVKERGEKEADPSGEEQV